MRRKEAPQLQADAGSWSQSCGQPTLSDKCQAARTFFKGLFREKVTLSEDSTKLPGVHSLPAIIISRAEALSHLDDAIAASLDLVITCAAVPSANTHHENILL